MDRLRVLVVDDHAGWRDVARRMLEPRFDVVGEAADAATTLSLAAVLRPDAVLLDVELPDADGFTVARTLAALPDPPRVVLVSVRTDHGRLVERSGACGFVPKADLTAEGLALLLARC
jgi:two-component system nitrate/nitrite response regulator NarL